MEPTEWRLTVTWSLGDGRSVCLLWRNKMNLYHNTIHIYQHLEYKIELFSLYIEISDIYSWLESKAETVRDVFSFTHNTCTKVICAAQKWPPFIHLANPCFLFWHNPLKLEWQCVHKISLIEKLHDFFWYCIETSWTMFQTVLYWVLNKDRTIH